MLINWHLYLNYVSIILIEALNRKDEERKDIQQKILGKDFNYLFHNPTKSSCKIFIKIIAINLN